MESTIPLDIKFSVVYDESMHDIDEDDLPINDDQSCSNEQYDT